jgi:hypothetical protein
VALFAVSANMCGSTYGAFTYVFYMSTFAYSVIDTYEYIALKELLRTHRTLARIYCGMTASLRPRTYDTPHPNEPTGCVATACFKHPAAGKNASGRDRRAAGVHLNHAR